MKTILICGSRVYTNRLRVQLEIEKERAKHPIRIVSGGARGADTFAEETADQLHLPKVIYHAEWAKYGKAAGHIRNAFMLEREPVDEVWAFTENLENSRGTKNMVKLAKKKKIPVRLFT